MPLLMALWRRTCWNFWKNKLSPLLSVCKTCSARSGAVSPLPDRNDTRGGIMATNERYAVGNISEPKKTWNKLRQYIRKHLQILIPDEYKTVLFRCYDPCNIWNSLLVLSEWKKVLFIGPRNKFITRSNVNYKKENFSMVKKKYPQGCSAKQKNDENITLSYE